MRQDWIEFEGKAIGKVLVRPEYIIWISDDKDCEDDGYVAIHVDDGSREGSEFGVNEPYEQVKQKIMDAERVGLSNVVMEHFTKDEYEILEYCLTQYIQSPSSPSVVTERYAKLQNKLNEILMEEE